MGNVSQQEVVCLRNQVAQLSQEVERLRQRDESARQREGQLQVVLMNLPLLVDAFDPGGSIVFWNGECERVTGYKAEEIIGNPAAMELLYPDREYRERMISEWRETGNGRRDWPWELTARDGSVRTVAWYNISGYVPIAGWKTWGIGVDVTEQKRAQRAIAESEERFRSLFENAADGLLVADPDTGKFHLANKAMSELTGYDCNELAQLSVRDIHPEERLPHVLDAFEQLARGGLHMSRSVPVKTKDGRILYADISAIPICLDGAKYITGSFRDVTEHRQLFQKLRESEERYRIVVESAGDSIAIIDENGVFLFLNNTAATRLGGTPESYVGKRMWDVFPQAIADRQAASVRKVIQTGHGINVVVPTALQGVTRWYNTTIEPLSDDGGVIRSALMIGRDIHDLVQTQKELEEYRTHMARAEQLASLGTLSATIAHEMNQPLTVLRLGIENCLAQLESPGSVEDVVEDLKECLEEVSVATSIVGRFRNFAAHSSRRKSRKTDLQRAGERVVDILRETARGRRVHIEANGLDHLGEFDADEQDMEQVFFSLVENAIQAADGVKDHRVLIRGVATPASVEVHFADDCGGIAPEHIGKIFEPFFTTKTDQEGTGLGLCIVKQALSRAGGTIQVDNRFGEGVTFVITIPRSPRQ